MTFNIDKNVSGFLFKKNKFWIFLLFADKKTCNLGLQVF